MSTTYATLQQLTDLGANERQLGGIAVEARTSALASASAQIDSYLSRVFKLPLLAFGVELARAAAVIAAWDLISVRGFNPETSQGQLLKERYDDVVTWLGKISEGKVKPAWPDTKTESGFNPTKPAFVLAPRGGGISLGDDCGGTVGKPKTRGW